MSAAESRRPAPDFTTLTKAQRQILAHIARQCGGKKVLVQSTRQMVRETGLVRRTVQTAIDRLNDLDLIYTYPSNSERRNAHRLLVEVVPGLSVHGLKARGAR